MNSRPALLEHLQQFLVFMPLLPRGEKAEAHPAAHGTLLETSEFFLRDRILNRIKVQKFPRLDQGEPGHEFREDRLELRPESREVFDRTRTIAKCVALAANGSVSIDHAGNEVVLMHLYVDQLIRRSADGEKTSSPSQPHTLNGRPCPARLPINTSAAPSARLNPFAEGTAQPRMATAS